MEAGPGQIKRFGNYTALNLTNTHVLYNGTNVVDAPVTMRPGTNWTKSASCLLQNRFDYSIVNLVNHFNTVKNQVFTWGECYKACLDKANKVLRTKGKPGCCTSNGFKGMCSLYDQSILEGQFSKSFIFVDNYSFLIHADGTAVAKRPEDDITFHKIMERNSLKNITESE